MAANVLEYAVLYQERLDEAITQELATAWMEGNAGQVRYDGGDTVKVPKRSVSGLGNYSKTLGYPTEGAVTLSYETFTLTQDRAQAFHLDARDVNETNFNIEAASTLKQFQTEKVAPEVDSYRFMKIFDGANKKLKTGSYTPAVGTIFSKLFDDITAVRDKIGSSTPLVVMMPFTVSGILAKSTEIPAQRIVAGSMTNGQITMKVLEIDGVQIVEVPSDRMKTLYTLSATDGFSASANAMQINWVIIAKSAPLAITKLEKVKILAPEQLESGDWWFVGYRRYHDIWIFDNQYDGVYVSYTPIAAPALTATVAAGSATGSTKFTATPGAGNVLKYSKTAAALTVTPLFNDVPTGLTAYTSGADIASATAGQHLNMFELDATGHVVAFTDHAIVSGDIK